MEEESGSLFSFKSKKPIVGFKYRPIEDVIKKENSRYFFAEITQLYSGCSHALVLELYNTNGEKSYLTIAPIKLSGDANEDGKIIIYHCKRTRGKGNNTKDEKIEKLIKVLERRYPSASIETELLIMKQ
jgi:hypothetical protein